MSTKTVSILGSTGSIGLNSISVMDTIGPDYRLISASAHHNWKTLAQQARKYQLEKVVLTDTTHIDLLRQELSDLPTKVLAGPQHLIDLAADPKADIIIVAVVGAVGLPAVLAAAQAGKTIAIANKESLVVAGCLVMPLAAQHNATILPIDSEHSAILQSLHSGQHPEVEKIIITCSGGPFRSATPQQLAQATLADALNHPTWNMGPKITIDSATMMNKALEIIEARWLFDIPASAIEVVIHPQSIIHSLVEFCDGSVIAQMSNPDMRLPIQYALTYPHRRPLETNRLKLHELQQLNFEAPDLDRFPAIRLGFEVADQGGTAGAVFNAANEAAVDAFRQGKIAFNAIAELTEQCLRKHNWIENPNLDQLLKADAWARDQLHCLITPDIAPATRTKKQPT
ncbi:MAG: 1-deoxy-D-xylulose-5-phosphate reductoisomerase [Sedimentisphaerales bacterium]|nr:1-deoxy-D-xylulose-5-phosphate reductoisomerase [Sedimentisphaerales bacterium]